MVSALWLLGGLALGAFGVWWLQRAELSTLRREKREAEDRLYYAFRDERIVPAPRDIAPVPVLPLSPTLQATVNDWESPEGRAVTEAKIRQMQADGLGEGAILRALDTPKY